MLVQKIAEVTEHGAHKQNEAALRLADAYRDLANKYREIAELLDREADNQVGRTSQITNQILNDVLGGAIEEVRELTPEERALRRQANGRDPLALVERLTEELRK